MKSLIHWWAKNHIAANFLMWALILGGIVAWTKLRKEIFPEISTNFISITLPYPNATPDQVRTGVVLPVEEAIQDVEGVKRITSNSGESVGLVFVEVLEGHDEDTVVNKLRARIDAIRNLAENAEKPIIESIPLRMQALSVAITAPTDFKTLQQIAEQLRDQLIALDAISHVELAAARLHEISIEVSEKTLREHGITFDQVAQAVRLSSVELPAGSVKTDGGEIIIRSAGRRYSAPEFADVTVLTRPDGSKVKLGEIAKVIDGFEENNVVTRFDGKDAVVLNVFRSGDEDTLEVAKAAKEYLEIAPRFLPQGVKLEVWNDLSLLLEGRMDLLANDALTGFILVSIILALFLRPALAFHVAMGIPIAFCGGVLFMPYLDVSVNMISLFAFILVLGIVTDDAIVVGENIYERMRKGEPAKLAAPRGAYEVMVVAIFGVFTVMISFFPMIGVSGVSGKIWRNIPWVVIPVLIISLIETNLILPAHLSKLKPEPPDEEVGWFIRLQRKITRGVDRFIAEVYKPFMEKAIRNRYITIAAFCAAAMIVVGAVVGGFIKTEFFPEVEGEMVSAKLTLANGVPFETTAAAIAKMEAAAAEINRRHSKSPDEPLIKHVMATVGMQPFKLGFQPPSFGGAMSHVGEVTLELIEASKRTIRAATIVSEWRELVGPIPGAVELAFISNTQRTGNAIDLEIKGADRQQLAAAAEYFKSEIAKIKGVTDISDNDREGKRELKLAMTTMGESLNLRLGEVARQVRQAFYGEEVQRLQRGRDEVKVMVRYPLEERRSRESLDSMKIRLPNGTEVPFKDVATAETTRGLASIYRAERQDAIGVTADVDKSLANANEIVASLDDTVFPSMKAKFPNVSWRLRGEQEDQRQSMRELGVGALWCLVGIYIVLAVPLRSYIQPIIVMSVIPFSLLGSVIGHYLLGYELSIMSMIGMVALCGIVVNESLVLVEYVNRHRRAGSDVATAARDAGGARFQAIMLTSVTSFIGVMPIILETSLQAKFLVPCGIALAFGCLFNMINALILVPCGYAVLEDIKRLCFTKAKIQKWEQHERAEAAERGLGWEDEVKSGEISQINPCR